MKKIFIISILALFSFSNSIDCVFTLENIHVKKGKIYYIVYDSDSSFLDESKAIIKHTLDFKPDSNSLDIEIKVPKDGYYALMVFHDINDNGKLDKNFFGIPKEPIAMSNNFKPKFKSPTFQDVKVFVDKKNFKFNLKLYNYY